MASKPAPFPSKDEVLRFVRESPGKVGRREIARAFGIRGNDRAALTELLRALEAEGALDGRRRRRRSDGRLPAVTVLVVEGLDSDGALTARPAGWKEPDPPPPITLDPAPRGVREPGVGDRVLARLRPAPNPSLTTRFEVCCLSMRWRAIIPRMALHVGCLCRIRGQTIIFLMPPGAGSAPST